MQINTMVKQNLKLFVILLRIKDGIKMIRVIIILLLLTSCTTNKKDINPFTTIVKQILTNGMSR